MRKGCLISTNNEDAHQSMHPVRTVDSVHATNKNIEIELSHTCRATPKTSVLEKFKVLSSGPFRGFVGHARYTNLPLIPPFRHVLSDYVLRYQIDKIAPVFIVIASMIMIKG